MRICYIVSEYFAWGQYGGYGTITRGIAEWLAEQGHEVSVLVPKRTQEAKRDQPDVADVNGVTVFGLPHSYIARLRRREIYSRPHADLYVSVDARLDSWMAMRMNPQARHAIWFIDPMSFETYWAAHNVDPQRASRVTKWKTKLVFSSLGRFGRAAVRRADVLLAQAKFLVQFAPEFYRVRKTVHFAPCPVEVPRGPFQKSTEPLVLFLGRFDWQKRPQMFFELAQRHPDVQFVAAGVASDPGEDGYLRRQFGQIRNLQMPGLVVGPEKHELLSRAWILCNSSRREGLPRSFLEGLAYECALLSTVDPDGLSSQFGVHASDGELDMGLRRLLTDDMWRSCGRRGHEYVRDVYEQETAVRKHIELYDAIISGRTPREE